jgi:putative ABC transport system permease protein
LKGLYFENIKIALRAVRSQALRTTLTALIIAVGIMALVGILTAIDALQGKIENDFQNMGSNTFSIQANKGNLSSRGGKRSSKRNLPVTFREAEAFAKNYEYPAVTSISSMVSAQATVQYGSEKTNPNVQVLAASDGYLRTAGYEVDEGRGFSRDEAIDVPQKQVRGRIHSKDTTFTDHGKKHE